MATQMHATVTAVSPSLRVRVDGATADSPANALGGVFNIGDRVEVSVSNPEPPLVISGGASP